MKRLWNHYLDWKYGSARCAFGKRLGLHEYGFIGCDGCTKAYWDKVEEERVDWQCRVRAARVSEMAEAFKIAFSDKSIADSVQRQIELSHPVVATIQRVTIEPGNK